MNLTPEDWILWATGFVGVLALLAALLKRGAAKLFPWFTGWSVYQLSLYTVLFVIQWKASYNVFFWSYWSTRMIEVFLVFAVIWELAGALFVRSGSWKPGTKQLVWMVGTIAVVIASLLACIGEPKAPVPVLRWCIRLNLFSAILTTELAAGVVIIAMLFGGVWKQWVTNLAIGMMLWFPIAFVVEMAHTYYGAGLFYKNLAHAENYAQLAAIAYWIFAFSRRQPEPQALPLKLEETIERLANMRWRP